MRRYTALAAAFACLVVAAPSALASSIVYEKNGNVWVAGPDGSGQRQVTTSGGYGRPSQADDGTIIATRGDVLERLNRSGGVLNEAGDDDYGGKIFTDTSPNGALASYGFFANGPILTGPYVAVSHANRRTEKEEIDGPLKGYLNPSWLDNNRILLFPQSLIVDVQLWPVGGNIEDWFADDAVDLGGGEVDRAMTKFAATADGGSSIRFYRLPAPPPALPEPRCQLTGPAGSFFHPTWSPDGTTLAWQEDDGIHTAAINLDTCEGESRLIIPGGKAPDWGPAAPGSGGGSTLSATAPKRIRIAALLRGITARVTCSCRAAAKLLLSGKTIGKASKSIAGSGRIKVKPTRAGKARLKRGGKSVALRITGAGKTVTKKVKILR